MGELIRGVGRELFTEAGACVRRLHYVVGLINLCTWYKGSAGCVFVAAVAEKAWLPLPGQCLPSG